MNPITLSKTNIRLLNWPKDSTHVRVTTPEGKEAVVRRKDIGTLNEVECSKIEFGCKPGGKKEFAPLAVQPDEAIRSADVPKEPKAKAVKAPKAKAKKEKPAKVPKEKKPKAVKVAKASKSENPRTKWNGHNTCGILKVLGAEKVPFEGAVKVLKAIGQPALADCTVKDQLARGKRGDGKFADVTADQKAELLSYAA